MNYPDGTIVKYEDVIPEIARLKGNDNFSPVWLPLLDEERIVFTSKGSDRHEIYVMDLKGRTLTNISEKNRPTSSSNKYNDFSPAWSPDGRFILFTSDRNDIQQIFYVNSDGSNPRQITKGAGSNTGASVCMTENCLR